MIWLAVHLSRMKPYRPLTGTPLSGRACVVTKTRFRVVYLTLTTTFALLLVLNLRANFVANSWKRHWPYFALGLLSIDHLFFAVPAQRLVVLGRRGAGKTALLVDLVLQRQNREADRTDRSRSDQVVPVLFSLSSWDPQRTQRDWLVDHLETEHPELQAAEYGDIDAPSQARPLVERNLVLPVLDGFDEISQPHQTCYRWRSGLFVRRPASRRRSLMVPPVERQLQLAHVVKVRAEDAGRLLQLGEQLG